jgi:hypothetical protein
MASRSRVRLLGRIAAGALGIGLAVYCVQSAGAGRILAIVAEAGPWLPAILALQIVVVALDALALRVFYGEAGRVVRFSTWLRATAYSNACSVFLPAGRAAGEALRATVLAPDVGGVRSGRAGACLQGSAMLAAGTTALVCAAVMGASTDIALLPTLLAGSGALVGALGLALLVLVKSPTVVSVLLKTLARVLPRVPVAIDDEGLPRRSWVLAFALCLGARAAQTLQYGVALRAVGGHLGVVSATTAEGIQLLGSTAGDVVPGQLGVLEGTYRTFAAALGVAEAPARAVSLVLLVRGALVGLALAGLVAAAFAPSAAPKE